MVTSGQQRRVAIFSDIHSNREALDAVLADIERRGVTERWCLGDVIGNGHDPVGCFDLVEQCCTVVLAGNHEVVVAARAGLEQHLPAAAAFSRDALRAAGGGRLESLVGRPSEWSEGLVRMAHGCPAPFDPVRDYLEEDVEPEAVLAACADAALICVGHTHRAGMWREGRRQLVNVGSVGEPGGGELVHTWTEVVWPADVGAGGPTVSQHLVEFDVERYRAHMAAVGLGLPPMWTTD